LHPAVEDFWRTLEDSGTHWQIVSRQEGRKLFFSFFLRDPDTFSAIEDYSFAAASWPLVSLFLFGVDRPFSFYFSNFYDKH